jgi:hypothetical protein
MTVICGASTAGKSTQPAQAWQRASLDGWTAPRRGDRARVNIDPADAEEAEAGLRLRAANFRQGVAVASARRPHRRTRANAQGPKAKFEVRRKRMAFWTK